MTNLAFVATNKPEMYSDDLMKVSCLVLYSKKKRDEMIVWKDRMSERKK